MGKYLAPCHDLLTPGLGSYIITENQTLSHSVHTLNHKHKLCFLSVLCLFDAIHDCFALTVEVTLT